MAEVTIRLPNRQTLLVLEPGVEVTAKEAPPSMTYKGQFPTVGMEPMVAFVTYLDENPNELTIETERTVTNDVEISASTERTVESDDPVLVEIEASTQRFVTNDVEITIPTVRNVTSFKVDLEIGTRRDVIVSGDMEIGTARHVEARIEIEASTVRNVLNDEDSEIGIPTKEYGSFVEKNKLFRVQHDVLNEDVSDNPYFEKQISNLRNAALLTRNQTIIKAINELFVSQREAFLSTFTALEKVNTTLGDLVTDKTLRAQYAKIGAESVVDGLVKLSANIDTIIDFIGMQSESLDYYKELGYEDLLATLKGMNEKIKTIDFNWDDLTEDDLAWMFRATDYIPEIKDQVFTLLEQMQDEIDAFKNGTASQFLNLKSETELTLARQYQTLIEKMNSSYERVTEEEIRNMFRAIGQIEDFPDEEEDVYFQMFQSLAVRLQAAEEAFENQINTLKQNQSMILQDLEGWADVTLQDIRMLFNDISEDQDAQDVYIELFRTFSERLDAQAELFEQEVARLESRIRQTEILESWAEVTEQEIKKIFDLFDPDTEPDEDAYAALFQQLSDRITENRELMEAYIASSSSELGTYANITEDEIRHIFELIAEASPEDPNKTFEDYIVELIQSLTTRLVNEEASLAEMQETIRRLKEENADVTEEEVRRLFEMLQDGDPEQSFEARVISIINGLTDRIVAQEEESDRLRQRIATLEEQTDAFTRSLDLLSRSITTKFNNFTEDVNSRVRSILSSLENAQHAIEGTVTYEALVAYLNSELDSTKSTVQELDNRVTGLEEKVEAAFTEEDIADEEEIRSMFDMTSWIDNYEVVSEDDIYKMFDKPTDAEGNPLPTTAEKVQDILDVIVDESEIYGMFPDLVEQQAEAQQQQATSGDTQSVQDLLDSLATEDDIIELFRQFIGDVEVNSMEELLELLANRNNVQGS